jgi:pSer/pThr/pTyr-binding forkhead associated (FHA) protein
VPAQSQPAQSQPVPAAPVRGTDQLPPAVAQPQAAGPRLVTRDGASIALPRTGGDIVIGREDPISGIHPEVDLTPYGGEAGGVSRRHAVLREQNGQWMLTDLDSTNYTRIDGNRLPAHTATPVHDGARVQFGRLEMEFHAG